MITAFFRDEVNRNVAWQAAGKGVTAVSALLLYALLTRMLGDAAYGEYVTVLAWMTIGVSLVDFGIYLTGLRELAKHPTQHGAISSDLFILKIGMGLTVCVAASAAATFFPYSTVLIRAIILIQASVFCMCVLDVFKGILQINYAMRAFTLAEVIGSLSTLAAAWLLLSLGAGLSGAVTALVSGHAVLLCITIVKARRLVRINLRFHPANMKRILIEALPLGISGIMAALFVRIDLLMLSFLGTAGDTGIYGASYRIIELANVLPALFMINMYPLLSKSLFDQRTELPEQYQKSVMFLAAATLPLTAGGILTAGPLMDFFTGSEFAAARSMTLPFAGPTLITPLSATVGILLLATPFTTWGMLNCHLLAAGEQQKKLAVVYSVLLPLNILLNLILIPKYSFLGAASATLISETGATIWTARLVQQKYKLVPKLGRLLPSGTACIVMVVLVHHVNAHVLIRIGVGAVSFIMVLIAILGTAKLMKKET